MIQKTIKQQNILQITILLIFMFLCPIPLKTANGVDGNELFKITVIDVGKGDCILIQTGEHTVMIDTGYKNTAENVIQFLKDHNITTIDTMIISHFHKDHVGGAAALIKSGIPITKIYMPDYKGTRSVYEDMIAALETHPEIEVIRLTEARSFTLGGAEYDIFPSSIAFDGDNDNNVSMAAMVKTDAHSAFKRSGLKYINIPDNVTSIDEKAFILSAELERVKLPAGLDAIKKNTFEGCTSLTNITIPESVTSIKASAFSACKRFPRQAFLPDPRKHCLPNRPVRNIKIPGSHCSPVKMNCLKVATPHAASYRPNRFIDRQRTTAVRGIHSAINIRCAHPMAPLLFSWSSAFLRFLDAARWPGICCGCACTNTRPGAFS